VHVTEPTTPAAVDVNRTSLAVGAVPVPVHDNVPLTVNAVNAPYVCVTGDVLTGDTITAVGVCFCTTNIVVPVELL
jgi:hypothetical protein